MKVGILHHDLEWAEKGIKNLLESKGLKVDLFDVRRVRENELLNYNLILNRVYASVANRDYVSNLRALEILNYLEHEGVMCINSYTTTLCDYSKHFAYKKMKSFGVGTPESIFLTNCDQEEILRIKDFVENYGFPLIVKRDMGGRGKDVVKVSDYKTLFSFLERFLGQDSQSNYAGGIIIQDYLENVRGYDCRIGIIDGEVVYSYARSLVPEKEGEKPWLASVSKGSSNMEYEPTEEEKNLALNATKSIGALFNDLDITFTKDGPMVIENNPTPNFLGVSTGEDAFMQNIVDMVLNKFKLNEFGVKNEISN